MITHPDQRVAVFIDTQNMYHSAKHLFGSRVNFLSVVQAAVAGRKLIRAIAYVVRTKTEDERPFFDALQKVRKFFFGGHSKNTVFRFGRDYVTGTVF